MLSQNDKSQPTVSRFLALYPYYASGHDRKGVFMLQSVQVSLTLIFPFALPHLAVAVIIIPSCFGVSSVAILVYVQQTSQHPPRR